MQNSEYLTEKCGYSRVKYMYIGKHCGVPIVHTFEPNTRLISLMFNYAKKTLNVTKSTYTRQVKLT